MSTNNGYRTIGAVSRTIASLGLFMALAALTGCAPAAVIRNYSGPMKAPDEVALVYLDLEPDEKISILPGQWLEGKAFVEMVPGTHKVAVGVHSESYLEGRTKSGMHYTDLKVTAGKRYRLYVPISGLHYAANLREMSDSSVINDWLRKRANGIDIQVYQPQ